MVKYSSLHFSEKLVGEMEEKEEGSDMKGMEEELADLDSLLPDLDAKVGGQKCFIKLSWVHTKLRHKNRKCKLKSSNDVVLVSQIFKRCF